MLKRKLIIPGLLALLLAACGGKDSSDPSSAAEPSTALPSATKTSVSQKVDALFERIDADTPWLFANLEVLPEELLEKAWAGFAPALGANRDSLNKLAEEMEDQPLIAALLREYADIDGPESLIERGLSINGHSAVHGVLLYPFAHWELVDADAFRAMIDRVTDDAQAEVEWRDLDDTPVLWTDLPDSTLGIALSYDDNFATMAVIPDEPGLLRRVANLDQPDESFAPKTLAQFSKERGYLDYGAGFVEADKVLALLFDSDDETLAELRASTLLGEIAGDAACRDELGALTGIFPRGSLGYTALDPGAMDFAFIQEAESDFARRLSVVADTPVQLGDHSSRLASLGLALNLIGARDFARDIVEGWAESPPRCVLFDGIGEKASGWLTALNQPIPPMVSNLYGFRANLDSLNLETIASPDATGTLAVFMRNPEMMLGMAQMFSPELAQLDLKPGGDPQPVPEGLIPNLPADTPVWAGMGKIALGLAFGADQKDRLNDTLDAGKGDHALFTYSMNMDGYAALMEQFADKFGDESDDGDNGDIEAQVASQVEALKEMARFYESSSGGLYLTERGMEFRGSVELRD
ncbi:MAG TPA: hypothetical protein VK064_06875 [Wenzhouxiangella sp.]|nr:hypothetical protein [Wenzhouxiangella sp.]